MGKKSWRGPRAGADANQLRLDPPSSTASPAAGSCFGSRQHCPPRASFQHPIPFSFKDFFLFLKDFLTPLCYHLKPQRRDVLSGSRQLHFPFSPSKI